MAADSQLPIGVFDSGVGGLSVLRHLRAELPAEHFLYVADSGHAPYGVREPDFIRERALAIGDFLVGRGVKALVIACNTATAAAATQLRARYAIPVVAMEPGIKPAVAATRNNTIGVLATAGTLDSARFFSLLSRYAGNANVITQPCPGLVEAIEKNALDDPATRDLVRRYLQPLLARGADTIVLGCTHYPFVRDQVAAIAGADVAIVETGDAVARELRRRLAESDLLDASGRRGGEKFWTSGDCEQVQSVIRRLWREGISVRALL